MASSLPRQREPASTSQQDETFHLGAFLHRWHGAARHDLTPSHSHGLSVAELVALASAGERLLWDRAVLDYATPRGAARLRALIAARYERLDADDVICCAGAQESMACVARAVLAPGDHAVVVVPLYQPLAWALTDRVPATGVPLEGDAFTLDLGRVAAAIGPKTRMVLINSPNSPTGAALDGAAQEALVALCRAHGLWLVNDEVYRETASAALPPPVCVAYERGISVSALSKGFGLPGLRVGWAACRDRAMLSRIGTAKAALSSCLAGPSEVLAQIALREEARLVGQARALGEANRAVLNAWLARYPGLFAPEPARNLAFAFPRYLGGEGAERFATRLAAETGTLMLPAGLWRTPLGPVPSGRLRISLGQLHLPASLAATEAFLAREDEAAPIYGRRRS